MNLKKKVPFPLLYAIALLNIGLAVLAGPFYPVPLGVILSIGLFYLAVRLEWTPYKIEFTRDYKKLISQFKFEDLLAMFLITVFFIFIGLAFGLWSFYGVPWWKIILVGILIDVIIYFTGMIPFVGDVVGALLTFIICILIIGGLPGIILSAIAVSIALIPGPVPLVTVSFILIKIVSWIIAQFLGVIF